MKKQFIAMIAAASMTIIACKKDSSTVDQPGPTPTPDPTPDHVVSSIYPTIGEKNVRVAIKGSLFGTNSAAIKVYFNGVEASVQSVADTMIIANAPGTGATGVIAVKKDTKSINGPSFTYMQPLDVITVAGSQAGFTDGSVASASFDAPTSVVKDASGNLFIADRNNNRIRKISVDGLVTTFAGGAAGFANGTGTAARFNQPYALAIDANNNIYVADRMNYAVRKITPAGVVTTLAGNGTVGDVVGSGSAARFSELYAIAIDSKGDLAVSDFGNGKIKKVTAAGLVSEIVNELSLGIKYDASDNLIVSEYNYARIVKVSSNGTITPIAGMGGAEGFADGAAASARFFKPAGLTIDAAGTIYVCDVLNNKIRKIANGQVSTLAGNTAGSADGTAENATFFNPIGIFGDFSSNILLIADFKNNRIRKIALGAL